MGWMEEVDEGWLMVGEGWDQEWERGGHGGKAFRHCRASVEKGLGGDARCVQ